MNGLQNKKIAVAVMVCLMIFAVLFGSHRSLTQLKNSAETIFYYGENKDGLCIQSDLDNRNEYAGNLVKIASNYLDSSSAQLTAVKNARSALQRANTIGEKYRANLILQNAVDDLDTALDYFKLSEKDVKYRIREYKNFNSARDTIAHDGYNQTATAINKILQEFPANILSTLTFVAPLELFS